MPVPVRNYSLVPHPPARLPSLSVPAVHSRPRPPLFPIAAFPAPVVLYGPIAAHSHSISFRGPVAAFPNGLNVCDPVAPPSPPPYISGGPVAALPRAGSCTVSLPYRPPPRLRDPFVAQPPFCFIPRPGHRRSAISFPACPPTLRVAPLSRTPNLFRPAAPSPRPFPT